MPLAGRTSTTRAKVPMDRLEVVSNTVRMAAHWMKGFQPYRFLMSLCDESRLAGACAWPSRIHRQYYHSVAFVMGHVGVGRSGKSCAAKACRDEVGVATAPAAAVGAAGRLQVTPLPAVGVAHRQMSVTRRRWPPCWIQTSE